MWVLLDCAMLLAVVVLEAWRFTGVAIHEWLAVALVAALLAHLAAHWPWLRSRARRIRQPRTSRTRVNFVLNVLVFVAMASAIVSGIVISKWILPSHADPSTYLRWRSIHGTMSRVALIGVGLHLGLNWDLLLAALLRKRVIRPRIAMARVATVAAWMIAASLTVGGVLLAVEHELPVPRLTMITRDGRRIEGVRPPADIAQLHGREAAPDLRGSPALLAHGILLAVSCFAGRVVLRLRLD